MVPLAKADAAASKGCIALRWYLDLHSAFRTQKSSHKVIALGYLVMRGSALSGGLHGKVNGHIRP